MLLADDRSSLRVRLGQGRRLRQAPRWDENVVLCFDAASGDYWVLSEDAADLLARLSACSVLIVEQSGTVASLVNAGLLELAEGGDA